MVMYRDEHRGKTNIGKIGWGMRSSGIQFHFGLSALQSVNVSLKRYERLCQGITDDHSCRNLLLKFCSCSLHKMAVATQLICLTSIEPADFLFEGYLVSFLHSPSSLTTSFNEFTSLRFCTSIF